MELRLDPEIPVTRVVNGHNVFNKGYHHGLRGKTYEEYYGKERAVEIRKRHSEALKGHRYWSNGNAHAFACIAITPEGKWYRFESITQAAQELRFKREFPCLQAGDDSVSFRLSFGLQYIFLLFLPIYDQRTLQNRILSRGMVNDYATMEIRSAGRRMNIPSTD